MSQRALAIPEVVLHICRYLDRQSRGRFARVCKQFQAAALDDLWRALDDFEPLIRTLPYVSTDFKGLCITRALMPSDWGRFQFYGDRVLEAKYRELSSSVSSAVLNHLAIYRPTLRILPRLRNFLCSAKTSQGLLSTIFLLSPTIIDISIYIWADVSDNAVATFFGTLQQYAAGVQSFTLKLNRTQPSATPIILSILPLLRSLKNITSASIPISVINGQTLACVASMPSLRSLFITASRQSIIDSEKLGVDTQLAQGDSVPNPFPVLEHLDITARMPTCIHIIRSLASPHVASVRVITLQLDSSSQMTECLSAIVATCPTLRRLNIDIREQHRLESPLAMTDEWYTLEPALLCPLLTHMSFTCPAPFSLLDNDLRRMCQAWTSLEHLSLNPRPYACSNLNLPSPPDTVLTLNSLSIPVKYCARLKHLGLLIDAVAPVAPPRRALSTTLSSLDLCYSNVSDIDSVATYLNTAYPAALCTADDKSSHSWPQESKITKWRQIDTLMRNLHKIRANDIEHISQLKTEVERSRARITELEDEIAMFRAQSSHGNSAEVTQFLASTKLSATTNGESLSSE